MPTNEHVGLTSTLRDSLSCDNVNLKHINASAQVLTVFSGGGVAFNQKKKRILLKAGAKYRFLNWHCSFLLHAMPFSGMLKVCIFFFQSQSCAFKLRS